MAMELLGAIAMEQLASLAVHGATTAARHLLHIETEHTRLLNQLTRGVDALLSSPYNTAIAHLEIAAKADTSPQRATSNLADAQKSFVAAYGTVQKVDPLQSAWAAVHLAIICTATQELGEARHWADHARDRATEALELLETEVKAKADLRVGRLKLNSEDASGHVAVAGAAGIGLGAAAAGVTIASGGLALPLVGAAVGAVAATSKGMDLLRQRQIKKGSARVDNLRAFLDDVNSLREQLDDPRLPPGRPG
jgi:hypothetical protein